MSLLLNKDRLFYQRVKEFQHMGTSDEQEMDAAVRFIVRNIDKLTEAQRAELIDALTKR